MPELIQPPPLSKGDRICIVPTARAIREDELRDGIELGRSWGFDVVLADNVGLKDNQFAGTDSERNKAFRKAWEDPGIHAIWCARGGYGTIRMLEGLDDSEIRTNLKWLVGFSDITALHNYLHQRGICSIHGQMPFAIGNKSLDTKQSILNALSGNPASVSCPSNPDNQHGEAEGLLVGGNLSVLYSLRGTAHDIDVRGKILFLEDLDELLYHVDRMIMNLRASGWHKQIAGLLVGGMTGMWDKNKRDPFGHTAEQIIRDALGRPGMPIGFGFPAGHESDNRALVLGKKAKLSVSAQGTQLSFG